MHASVQQLTVPRLSRDCGPRGGCTWYLPLAPAHKMLQILSLPCSEHWILAVDEAFLEHTAVHMLSMLIVEQTLAYVGRVRPAMFSVFRRNGQPSSTFSWISGW
jgi:hypothetical protein